MINLNTCVKGQKLRLRDGRIATYAGLSSCRDGEYNHAAIAENGNEGHYIARFTYTDQGGYFSASQDMRDVVEILSLETTEFSNPDNHPFASTTMINLNTCAKGQKLRLRNGRIVTYIKNGWSSEYPHETRMKDGGVVSYKCNGSYHPDGAFSTLDVVEILPLETTDKHPSVAWWESCPWITDRKPTKDDGDANGCVIIEVINNLRVLVTCWEYVEAGQPWIHSLYWQPPALTDREQALKLLDDHQDGWRPTPEQWHVIRKGLEAS